MKIDKKKKPRGMKHKIREEKRIEERIGMAVIVTVLLITISVSGFLINSMLNPPSTKSDNNQFESPPKAAIVDHLSLTVPNQTFVETATNTLKQAGFIVDYYPGEEVTVEFYINLPTHKYDIVILRVHSSAHGRAGQEVAVSLFTSERVNMTKYVYEQQTDQLVEATFSGEEREKGIIYFGITPLFITYSMRGRFSNTVIIMMGCEGLHNPLMAIAFVEKGAKAYISWNGSVLASHTDLATTHLLQHLLIQKQTLEKAVRETMQDVGPDPAYKSELLHYPLEAGDYTAPSIIDSIITNRKMNIKHHRENVHELWLI